MKPAPKSSSTVGWVAVAGCVGLFVAGALWLARGLRNDERTSGVSAPPLAGGGDARGDAGAGTPAPTSPPPSLATAPRPPAPPPSHGTPPPGAPAAGSTPGAAPRSGAAGPGDPAAPPPRPGSRVSGLILDPDGTPVAGATVWAGPAGDAKRGRVYARTRADGSYLLEGLRAGRWLVGANRADRTTEVGTVEVSGSNDLEVPAPKGELLPPSSVWLAGTVRVLGPDGRPVPFAQVAVLLPPSPERGPPAAGFAGFAEFEDGTFHRGTPEAVGTTYLVFAAAPSPGGARLGYGPGRFVAEKPADGQVELRLDVGPTLEGRVEDEGGNGVAGVPVEAYSREAVVGGRSTPQLPFALDATVTDASGAFVLRGVDTGPGIVVAHGTSGFVRSVPPATVPGGARGVRFVLRKGVEARVLVLDPSGVPVAKASVDAGVTFPLPQTDDDGVLVLTGLDPLASPPLRVTPPFSRADLLPWSLQAWRPADVTVRLGRGHHVKGRIVGPDGTSGVVGVVQRRGETGWTPLAASQRDGTFELRGLGEGPWTLRAAGLAAASPTGPEVVVTDETAEVRLVLPEAAPGPK